MSASRNAPVHRPDTADMGAIHRVFRDALASAPTLIGDARDGDVSRSRLVASYYSNVLALLKGHHEGEDQLLTPLLVERCNAADVSTVERIGGQHASVQEPVLGAESAINLWSGTADAGASAEALLQLRLLRDALVPHLDEEETMLLPLAAEQLSAEEWGQLPRHGLKTFAGDNIWLVMGLIREQMTTQQLASMDSAMPPPVSAGWQATGQSEFEKFVGALRS